MPPLFHFSNIPPLSLFLHRLLYPPQLMLVNISADSRRLTLSPPPLRHPTHVISTGCLSHAPAFQPAAANEPLCERTERERQRGREQRNPVTVRKLNLERLPACHNKAHGTHSAALKWKITGLGHTPASFLSPLILVELRGRCKSVSCNRKGTFSFIMFCLC